MNINDRLKKAIKSKGYTIAAVAQKMRNERGGTIGISQPSLSEMLNGNISFSRVEEIANIIGVSLAELVAEENMPPVFRCPKCGNLFGIVSLSDESARNFFHGNACADSADGSHV